MNVTITQNYFIVFYFLLFFFLLLQLYCPNRISPMGNSDCFSWGKPAVTELPYPAHCKCWVFSDSIINRILTWTTVSLMCAQMLMHAIAHEDTERESALKVDCGKKIPRHTGEPNLRSPGRRVGGGFFLVGEDFGRMFDLSLIHI